MSVTKGLNLCCLVHVFSCLPPCSWVLASNSSAVLTLKPMRPWQGLYVPPPLLFFFGLFYSLKIALFYSCRSPSLNNVSENQCFSSSLFNTALFWLIGWPLQTESLSSCFSAGSQSCVAEITPEVISSIIKTVWNGALKQSKAWDLV